MIELPFAQPSELVCYGLFHRLLRMFRPVCEYCVQEQTQMRLYTPLREQLVFKLAPLRETSVRGALP